MLNQAVFVGRITKEPEVKNINSGNKILQFCLAVARDRAGNNEEKQTDFIDCTAWNETAEFIAKYFKKGDPVIANGRIESRQYEDKQGNKKKAVYLLIRNVNFCAYRKAGASEEEDTGQDMPF